MSEQDIIYGSLGEDAAVFHDESWGQDHIAVQDSKKGRIDLTPRQFLSLLDWGNTYRDAIEQLFRKQKGRAYITLCFPDNLWPEGVSVPKVGQVHYNLIECQDLFEKWSTYLLLPEGYTICGVFFDILRYSWEIIVESEFIPLPARGEIIPEIYATYQHSPENNTVRLVSLKLAGEK